MKLSLSLEADAIKILDPNMGRIALDIDGVESDELIHTASEDGCLLQHASEIGETMPLPSATQFGGIQCSTAHITDKDNSPLNSLSQQSQAYGGCRMDYVYRCRVSYSSGCVGLSRASSKTTGIIQNWSSVDYCVD